jgi:putative transposase
MSSSTTKKLDALKRAQHIAGLRSQVQQGVEVVMRDLEIPDAGVAYVRSTMSAPSRREGGGASNWSGFAPSAKMGLAIGFESGTLEYPATTKCERDDRKIAYFNQAPYIKLLYTRADGKNGGHTTRPDYLVVEAGEIGLVECKMEAELVRESQLRPWLYQRRGEHWVSPPAERAAAEMGMSHWIWTEKTFSPISIKNHLMLEDYLASNTDELAEADAGARGGLIEYLEAHPRATITAASNALRDVANIDQIYRAIAFRIITVDFDNDSLADQDRCMLYRDADTMQAFLASATCPKIGKGWMKASQLTLEVGVELEWDGACWKLANLGGTEVTLANSSNIHALPRKVFDRLVDRSKIVQRSDASAVAGSGLAAEAYEKMSKASPNDMRYAALCLRKIEPFLHRREGPCPPPSRTQRRHLAAYRAAEAVYGNGFVGLLPGFSKCGNTKARLAEETLKIVQERVNADYANPKGVRAKRVHDSIVKECKEKSFPAPSYAWFCRFINRLDIYNLKKAREGSRAANNEQPRVDVDENGIDLTPQRPFERAALDHTELDLETRDSRTSKKTGKVWVSILVDLCTRRILAMQVTFEPPSYRSVLAVLRDCVRRYGRLPASILVDGGKDMASTWFETTCAFFGVKVFRRPAARPRFGSQNERMFGTINSMFAHALCGNTQLRKNVRQMTDEVDPDVFSVWTLVELYPALEEFLFEVYDNLPHRELHESPREAFERLLAQYGDRPERRIAYNSDFLITTCPSTPKGTARVQPDGVKLNYVYFNHPLLAKYLRKDVPVRYDADDMSKAYAFIGRQWLPLKSKYSCQLKGRTEHEIKLLTAEHRARRSETEREAMSATLLVDFLDRVAVTEEQLLRQRQINEQRLLNESRPTETGGESDPPAEDDSPQTGAETPDCAPPEDDDGADPVVAVPAAPPKAPRPPKATRAVTLVPCEQF